MFSHGFFSASAFSPSYFPPNGGFAPVYATEEEYPWDVFQDPERDPVFPVYQR